MATPKRITKNDEKDYADIYQENFVAQNDPAKLGQAAFNRQLSSGIQRNMGQERLAQDTNTAAVAPRYGMQPGFYTGTAPGRSTPAAPGRTTPAAPGSGFLSDRELVTGPGFQAGFRQQGPAAGTVASVMPDLSSIAMGTVTGALGVSSDGLANAMSGIRQGNLYDAQTAARQAQYDAMVGNAGTVSAKQGGYSQYAGQEVRQPKTASASQLGGYSSVDNAGIAMQRRADAEARAAQGQAGLVDSGFRQGNVLGDAVNDPNIDRRLGLQAQAAARRQQLRLGDPSATATAGYGQSGDIRRDQNQSDIYARQGELRGAQMARLEEIANLNAQRDARAEQVDTERRIGESAVSATAGAGYGISGDRRRAQIEGLKIQKDARAAQVTSQEEDRLAAIDAAKNQRANELGTARMKRLDEIAGLQSQKDARAQEVETEARIGESAVSSTAGAGYGEAGDIRRDRIAGLNAQKEARKAEIEAGVTAPTLDDVTGGGSTGGGATGGGATGGDVNDGGPAQPRTSTPVSSTVSQAESNLYATLDAERDQVLTQFNNSYNQFMQLAINRGAVRGNLEDQGFTGGIGRQIQDYLSTGEMSQLNQLMMDRDKALTDIELRRNDVPNLALRQEAETLQLAQANIALKTQFSQDLAASVISGQKSLDEAQAFADEYGLQNIQDLIISAAKAEIKAGADSAAVRQNLIDAGIDPGVLDSDGGLDVKTFTEISNDFMGMADNALAIADKDELTMDSWVENTSQSGFLGNAFGRLADLSIGLAGFFGLLPDMGVGEEDRTVLLNDLVATDFYQTFAEQLQSDEGMSAEVTFVRDRSTQGQGLGFYNDTYRINVGGATYEMKGVDAVTLVSTLKANGFEVPQGLLDLAEEVYNEDLGGGFERFKQAFGGKESYADALYKAVFNKPARKGDADNNLFRQALDWLGIT